MAIKKVTSYINDDGFEFTFEPIEDSLTIDKTKDGFEVRYLAHDPYPLSPEEDGDDNLFLVHYHRDFTITNPCITEDDLSNWYQGEKIPQEKDYHIFKVSALIHSGVRLSLVYSFSCVSGGWAPSHVGAILASKKEWKTKEKAVYCAEKLIEIWNQYLSDDVYICIKELYDSEKKQLGCDCVRGYYGYKEALEELKTFD